MRDFKIGIICGLIGFFLIVLPLLKLMEWADKESRKPREDIVVYIKEVK